MRASQNFSGVVRKAFVRQVNPDIYKHRVFLILIFRKDSCVHPRLALNCQYLANKSR